MMISRPSLATLAKGWLSQAKTKKKKKSGNQEVTILIKSYPRRPPWLSTAMGGFTGFPINLYAPPAAFQTEFETKLKKKSGNANRGHIQTYRKVIQTTRSTTQIG